MGEFRSGELKQSVSFLKRKGVAMSTNKRKAAGGYQTALRAISNKYNYKSIYCELHPLEGRRFIERKHLLQ